MNGIPRKSRERKKMVRSEWADKGSIYKLTVYKGKTISDI
jgi:hypothetical protein